MRSSEQLSVRSSAICARRLTKKYPYTEQIPGIVGALKGLVRPRRRERLAVDDLCLADRSSDCSDQTARARPPQSK